MQTKRTVVFFSVLLVLSILPCSVSASSNATVSSSGGGVIIELTYPEEAHPNVTITHNIMITATAPTALQNFTAIIKTSVNSSWVEVFNAQDTFSQPLPKSYNLTIQLPEQANGKLLCFIFVNTSSIDDLSTTLYTTLVSEPTSSEMRVLYYEMLANYTSLQEDYEALLEDYNGLVVNYSSLLVNYTSLLTEYDVLSGLYDDQVSAYQKKLSEYNALSDKYNNLQDDFESKSNELSVLKTEFNDLNETHYELHANYTSLETNFNDLKSTYTGLFDDFENIQNSLYDKQGELNSDRIVMIIFVISCAVLIAFIIYLKRNKQDPYLIIRKETVSMKSDKET